MESTDRVVAGRLRLAAELRRLRDLSGVSGRDLAKLIPISQSKISRIESGQALPTLPEVAKWAQALNASEETTAHLVFLTTNAFTEVQPWRELLSGAGHLQDEVEQRESGAKTIQILQVAVVPGLLQTADYARRLLGMSQPPYMKEDLSVAVAARLHRQRLVFDEGRQFEFLITDAALRWKPGPVNVLLAQWDRIASIATLGNVSIGLIPQGTQASATMSHGFAIYHPADDEHLPFVTVEMIHAAMTVHDPSDVALYEKRWSLLSEMAIFDDEAQRYLAKLAHKARSTVE
ncbi:transcriptional regulator with XRE-family HTH domain [Kibdelosporangium banguiense]|uniref:Transcriptional regulator with XRE-family HTH domain n=1 Tax=Kibdelosporangium banguiense TaxID=1365924 RepID=A0ABS4TQU7_9PSEU|nr:helix-turn-helix transcriptional regulator [Kibdelosporangium banguiense]MBP2326315.1 transcriptional regulator with XRE-family HTH domain [Kibdelosporangium banguiense]